jgi:hypothetical protein
MLAVVPSACMLAVVPAAGMPGAHARAAAHVLCSAGSSLRALSACDLISRWDQHLRSPAENMQMALCGFRCAGETCRT